MSDLTDALEWHHSQMDRPNKHIRVLAAAARRVAEAPEWLRAMLENPPEPDEKEWCEAHGLPGTPGVGECLFWYTMIADQDEDPPCRMVRKLLVDP